MGYEPLLRTVILCFVFNHQLFINHILSIVQEPQPRTKLNFEALHAVPTDLQEYFEHAMSTAFGFYNRGLHAPNGSHVVDNFDSTVHNGFQQLAVEFNNLLQLKNDPEIPVERVEFYWKSNVNDKLGHTTQMETSEATGYLHSVLNYIRNDVKILQVNVYSIDENM